MLGKAGNHGPGRWQVPLVSRSTPLGTAALTVRVELGQRGAPGGEAFLKGREEPGAGVKARVCD